MGRLSKSRPFLPTPKAFIRWPRRAVIVYMAAVFPHTLDRLIRRNNSGIFFIGNSLSSIESRLNIAQPKQHLDRDLSTIAAICEKFNLLRGEIGHIFRLQDV